MLKYLKKPYPAAKNSGYFGLDDRSTIWLSEPVFIRTKIFFLKFHLLTQPNESGKTMESGLPRNHSTTREN